MHIETAKKLLNMYLELNPHRHDMGTAVKTVLAELDKQNEAIENYKNTIEVMEELGQMKIEKQIELARQKWGG